MFQPQRFTTKAILQCVLVSFFLRQISPAAEPAQLPPDLAVHLVGHEDSALLQRVQAVIDDWDPRRLVNPIVETSYSHKENSVRAIYKQLKRPDLEEFIADVAAAEALGKMFFWEMQAGSDFRRLAPDADRGETEGKFVGTACASCHYRFGADARHRHTQRVPLVVWNQFPLSTPLDFGEQQQAYDVTESIRRVVDVQALSQKAPFFTIIGSQGVAPRMFGGIQNDNQPPAEPGYWASESSQEWQAVNKKDDHTMFIDRFQTGHKAFRQITGRNAPTTINSGFADRLFHDGRAESTFNGFSIFGDSDRREVIHRRKATGRAIPVTVAITRAALASQAVGPIVNEVEMSYQNRTFPDLAKKLLDSPPLKYQEIAEEDSLLKPWLPEWVGKSATKTYRELIQRAFRKEWWENGRGSNPKDVVLELTRRDKLEDNFPYHDEYVYDSESKTHVRMGTLMEANFSLYWGLSLMLYQSSLVSNETPFDAMMQGNPKPVNKRFAEENALGAFLDVPLDQKRTMPLEPGAQTPTHQSGSSLFQHGFRTFLRAGCVDCHAGPLFSEAYDRNPEPQLLGIQHQIDQVLIPNSRADALALRRQAAHTKTLEDLQNLLVTAEFTSESQAGPPARELDLLREIARGSSAKLADRVEAYLNAFAKKLSGENPQKPDAMTCAATAKKIAERLIRFEKNVHREFGNRIFFPEEERMQLITPLVASVGVEKGRLRPEIIALRPALPIQGPGPLRPVFFYDLGFYVLGVAPPRYDRGNGGIIWYEDDSESNQSPLASASLAPAGSAYRLKRSRKARPPETQAETNKKSTTASIQPPASSAAKDASWDRSALPEEERRANQHFISRARRLVSDENPWGYRKPFLHDNELAFWGAFKTPSLRNVELTAPYMHNGRLMTLSNVIDFYDMDEGEEGIRGVPRDKQLNPDLHPAMHPLDLTDSDKLALHFFLLCLTDSRVRLEKGPFDHPSLNLVHGYHDADPDHEIIVRIPEIGRAGHSSETVSSPFPSEN